MPNAPVSGIDASYEWVELTNVGPTSASLEGMRLEDNHATLDVDPIVLAPGASLVIAAPLADVGAAAVVQRVPVIGNGLSNTGDRLALYAIDGTLVDALSYGSDETYMVEDARITAPRSGYSIVRRFGPDGTLVDVLHSAAPTPGVAQLLDPAAIAQADDDPAAQPEPVAATEDAADDPAPIPAAPRAQTAERSMWTTLLLVAAALVGGFASRRTASIIREHRAAAAQARDLSGD